MRPKSVPPALTARPFTVADARDAGVSWRMLQGQRFCSPVRGVYAPAGTDDTLVGRVISTLAVLPPATLATGVTGLQLMRVDVGSAEPLRFLTASPRQVRRRGIRVPRVSVLPPVRGLRAVPEHCWMAELLARQAVPAGHPASQPSALASGSRQAHPR
jgi:hypothetical protein